MCRFLVHREKISSLYRKQSKADEKCFVSKMNWVGQKKRKRERAQHQRRKKNRFELKLLPDVLPIQMENDELLTVG